MTNRSSYYGTSRGNPYRRYTTDELLRDLESPQLVGDVRAEIEAEIARRTAKAARRVAR